MPIACPEGCGRCCCTMPIETALINRHRKDFQTTPQAINSIGSSTIISTPDKQCIFLIRESKRCAIYDDRPQVCRLFGDSKKPMLRCEFYSDNGTPRTKKETLAIQKAKRKEEQKLKDMLKQMEADMNGA